MTYEKKAPAFANIDNVEDKFEKHFGRLYKGCDDFIALLKEEETYQLPGSHIETLTLTNGRQVDIRQVCLDDEAFHE